MKDTKKNTHTHGKKSHRSYRFDTCRRQNSNWRQNQGARNTRPRKNVKVNTKRTRTQKHPAPNKHHFYIYTTRRVNGNIHSDAYIYVALNHQQNHATQAACTIIITGPVKHRTRYSLRTSRDRIVGTINRVQYSYSTPPGPAHCPERPITDSPTGRCDRRSSYRSASAGS